MITEFSIAGYKSLRDISLRTARLNVLVGGNACGKSSVLQTLLLLRQSPKDSNCVSKMELSGSLFEAGTVQDVLHPDARKSGMKLTISADNGSGSAHFAPEFSGVNTRQLKASAPFQLVPPLADEGEENFAYLSAERIGPKVTYGLPRGASLAGPVGMQGEFTTAFLARCQRSDRATHEGWYDLLKRTSEFMPEDLVLDEASKSNYTRLDLTAKQILAWMIPGVDFLAFEDDATDSAKLSYIRDPGGTKTPVRPTHMGFGVTYALPVIAASLAIPSSGLLLIENPEAHLHPSSQSRMGTFLALAARQGAQIFTETHSDHVVNGVRLAVKGKLVAPEDVKFFFFKKSPRDESTLVTELSVTPEGSVTSWPEGFFDQIERDLARL